MQKINACEKVQPLTKQTKGEHRWAVRLRLDNEKPVLHFMNTALKPIPHATIKDISGIPVLKALDSNITDNELEYEINTSKINWINLSVMSPELKEVQRLAEVPKKRTGDAVLTINLDGVKVYAVAK